MLVYFSPCPRNMWRSGFNQKYCLSEYIIKQEKQEGISLGVQWFRLLWPNTGDAGSISGQGTMILHAGQCGQKLKKKRERRENGRFMQQSVTQKPGSPLGGCQAKRHNQTRDQDKEEFIILCSDQGEHQRSFPKQCLLGQQSW